MWLDVIDLRDFYASPVGEVAGRMIARQVRSAWPDVSGLTVAGVGFAGPYLADFQDEAACIISAMPASQGVIHWPTDGAGRTILADEAVLPLPDLSVDRLLLVHAVECAEAVRPMMREAWRVLSAGGRLMVVTPNRRGIWARLDRTPFGYGRPYTPGQLNGLLRETMFTPVQSYTALYIPPSRSRMMLSAAPAWENIGQRWFRAVGGIIAVEATKQIYAATPSVEGARQRIYAPAPSP
jgi:SAM-dependent methyltransferase